jgi:hypothetical protein
MIKDLGREMDKKKLNVNVIKYKVKYKSFNKKMMKREEEIKSI